MLPRTKWIAAAGLLLVGATTWYTWPRSAGPPDPVVIELARAKGFVLAHQSVAAGLKVEVPRGTTAIAAVEGSAGFSEDSPPEVETWDDADSGVGPDESGTSASGPPPGRRARRRSRPNWTLRPGDLTGDCSVDFVSSGSALLAKMELDVRAQTPHGIVERLIPAGEMDVSVWAPRPPKVRPWPVLEIRLGATTGSGLVAGVTGYPWRKGIRRRLGFYGALERGRRFEGPVLDAELGVSIRF